MQSINWSGTRRIRSFLPRRVETKRCVFGTFELPKLLRLFKPKVEILRVLFIYFSFSGENLNITWHPNGECIAVGNKDDLIQFIDTKTYKPKGEKQFKFEVNEISWNNAGTNFFLTTGTGALHVLDYPKLNKVDELVAHTANCISIQFR